MYAIACWHKVNPKHLGGSRDVFGYNWDMISIWLWNCDVAGLTPHGAVLLPDIDQVCGLRKFPQWFELHLAFDTVICQKVDKAFGGV